ncbi:MAG: DegT/DnrJ/EryC1/StrS aminotransferase family protein [Candidatus Omnitrophica bacterium]|nr:DegT/DnrJ/EryC1/StrS aminotransferase family protein [Candidatus Omnitrophota bacterium]
MKNKTVFQHSRPELGESEVRAAARVIRSGKIASGDVVRDFESRFSGYLGVKGAVAVNSGTSALHLALKVLGTGPGDEVILPSFVCPALLNAIYMSGASPVIVDVNYPDFNISPEAAKKRMTARTKCVIVPHMFGCPADLRALINLGVPVIEDAAQSLGAVYGNNKVGSLGAISIFSFYATKMMTTGEGGMLASNDRGLLKKMSDQREYDNKPGLWTPRFNYKMTDIQAAIGISQLSKIGRFIKQRDSIAGIYDGIFSGSGPDIPVSDLSGRRVYYRYVLKIKGDVERAIKKAGQRGIICARPVYKPLNRYLGLGARDFGNSEKLFGAALSIPVYPGLSDLDAVKIGEAVRAIL